MRTTLVVLFLGLTMNLGAAFGQGTIEAAVNHHLEDAFGARVEPDRGAVAAYAERLSPTSARIGLADEGVWRGTRRPGGARVWVSQENQPAPERAGGSRFGGPLVWAMVIIAATSVGFVYLGIRLSPRAQVIPSEG